jgi:RimJ/RimL family protein N-acetyltransferase
MGQGMTPAITPTLRTERLTLRRPRMADFAGFAAFLASDSARNMGGPFSIPGAWGYFCHETALWELIGHGAFMVDQTATGMTVGSISLSSGPIFPGTDLGWLVYDGHTGQGYATEAAMAVRDWALTTLKLPMLVSYIDPGNTASRRVADRLGAVIDDAAPRPIPTDIVYRYWGGN